MAGNKPVPRWLIERPIAHRGLHDGNFPDGSVPENSLLAFERAIQSEFPIELDVHLLADGEIVVFHDHGLQRMTGQEGRLASLDTKALRTLRLQGSDQRIPLLSEVLQLVDGRVGILIELKNLELRVGRLEEAVVRLLADYRGEYAIQSFNPLSILELRRRAPGICRGQLSTGLMGIPIGWLTRPDFVAFNIQNLPKHSADRARQQIPVLAWTIREEKLLASVEDVADNLIFEVGPGLQQDDINRYLLRDDRDH